MELHAVPYKSSLYNVIDIPTLLFSWEAKEKVRTSLYSSYQGALSSASFFAARFLEIRLPCVIGRISLCLGPWSNLRSSKQAICACMDVCVAIQPTPCMLWWWCSGAEMVKHEQDGMTWQELVRSNPCAAWPCYGIPYCKKTFMCEVGQTFQACHTRLHCLKKKTCRRRLASWPKACTGLQAHRFELYVVESNKDDGARMQDTRQRAGCLDESDWTYLAQHLAHASSVKLDSKPKVCWFLGIF